MPPRSLNGYSRGVEISVAAVLHASKSSKSVGSGRRSLIVQWSSGFPVRNCSIRVPHHEELMASAADIAELQFPIGTGSSSHENEYMSRSTACATIRRSNPALLLAFTSRTIHRAKREQQIRSSDFPFYEGPADSSEAAGMSLHKLLILSCVICSDNSQKLTESFSDTKPRGQVVEIITERLC